jgi:transcription-repair coupling factor (superfamily II helicase)
MLPGVAAQTLRQTITDSQEFQQLAAEIRRGARVVSLGGLSLGPARALVLAALRQATGRRFALAATANRDLEAWETDISFWREALGDKGDTLTLPAVETDPYAAASPHAELLEERALALWKLAQGGGDFVILSSQALAQRAFAPEEVKRAGAFLRRDEDYDLNELRDKLLAAGYLREDPVNATGEFSLRGGILDVWPPGREFPVRVEFFGDTVDSLREFDAETQLSVNPLKELEIPPMRELCVGAEDFKLWADFAREHWADERYNRALRDRAIYADDGETFAGWEWLLPLLHEPKSSVFAYLRDAVLIVDEPAMVEKHLSGVYETLRESYAATEAADELGLAPDKLYLTPEELREKLEARPRLELRALGRAAAETDDALALETEASGRAGEGEKRRRGEEEKGSKEGAVSGNSLLPNPHSPTPLFLFPLVGEVPEAHWNATAARRYHGRWPELARELKQARAEGRATLLLTHTHGLAERVREVLAEYDAAPRLSAVAELAQLPASSGPFIVSGYLSGGFVLPNIGLTVHVESDIYDQADGDGQRPKNKAQNAKAKRANFGAFLSDFRDLKPGDFVVHIDHGIGRFGGLQTLEMQGRSSEFMLLYFAEDSKLFVPVERLDLVQRYSSGEGQPPTLDKLGGIGWQKTKAKAKRAMRDMADELIKLYAERKLVRGHAFTADSPWQDEFEGAFEFEPTVDQAAAIEDVKRDMEAATPMDRLLCGDVGYGKTEVAMRAAFKAVMEGKQVAVLTPTTVLAYQHFETFQRRFAAFPVKVELLSRLRSAKEQKEIVNQLEAGAVDVIIGTHRILSKDIVFKDLGLVVVDEEQRFGVAHKERLKHLKKRVDVLTLSATPIPRTLNMSLMGMRDMSVIETPPRDRLAINTQVVPSSENVIKAAIAQEMGRGGQVFFIHNRVETIDAIAGMVKRLAPDARVAVGHGQMNEAKLEEMMLDFVHYKYDVLVATTIIENGIDIPRANTIIINRADAYGLSQLYQLRGRVGRSSRRAYAYLLIPGEQTLTPIARRRLSAIREFSDLGAGFRIAALDLELRGAGNFLGGEQSGHLDALGFDLYAQMLERTVQELRGEAIEDEPSVSINLGVDVAIPQDYIADMNQRLRVYKRISAARDDEKLSRLRDELQDRYGRVPPSVENLLQYAQLRRLAEEVGAVSLDRAPTGLVVKLFEKARVAPEKLLEIVEKRPGVTFTPNGALKLPLEAQERENLLDTARAVLLAIRSA